MARHISPAKAREIAEQRQREQDALDLAKLVNQREHEFQLANYAETISQTRAANFSAGLEIDKTLLTLASAGIGAQVTLAVADKDLSRLALTLFSISTYSFLACVFASIVALHQNRKITQGLLEGAPHSEICADIAESLAFLGFSIGAFCTVFSGVLIAFKNYLPEILK